MRKISQKQFEELEKWLTTFDLIRHDKKIYRDFSDGVLLAKILKQSYPKIVELHNYPPRSSTLLKLSNWETLNRKVLKKLDLYQTENSLKQLAQGKPGVVEYLLYQVMDYIKSLEKKPVTTPTKTEAEENGDIMTVNVCKTVGDGLVQVPQVMILYSFYEKAKEEIAEKDKVIAFLNQKVLHLENLLKLKSQRLRELSSELFQPSLHSCLSSACPSC